VIVREAGGLVTGLEGRAFDLENGDTLAANPALHAEMVPVATAARARWG
jgi:fructose-1,6-bisphosphatase/inositol monophosphatase family enzyme